GGDGAHPVADACDYARHCAALDFWSINDHAVTLGPRRWTETVDTIRQCNALVDDPKNPDTVAFLGWEWTQVGPTPESHYGHKNVILRDLADDEIPARPISSGIPLGAPDVATVMPSPLLLGLLSVSEWETGGPEFARYLSETAEIRDCPAGVPVRELPTDCREAAPTPEILFDKLDDWGLHTMVIPHGTTWGFYTPPGSSWDKQLSDGMHDPNRQRIIEVMSGHGNSEEFRSYREVIFDADGDRSCPEPSDAYLPSCWRAGEIIEARCLAEGEGAGECASRAATARQHWVDADRNGGFSTVPATEVADWQDAGQCRDCFQPSFNYRPRSSVQYIMALARPDAKEEGADRFRFGFIASSDNHSARPGTGYKEVARSEFTEARFGNFVNTPLGEIPKKDPVAHSEPMDEEFSTAVFSIFETERGSSFFLNGGLAAVHSEGRSREEIWDAMQRKEVYGTSGPRILLWFDLLNGPAGRSVPMGGQVSLDEPPIFQVRAVGSFEQKPGCPADAAGAMGTDRVARLCQGECYHPSDQRRPITRLEVVRILPQNDRGEEVEPLIQDPWRVISCAGDGDGCTAAFTDPEFTTLARDAVYYVRAIEASSPAVAADPLGCTRYEEGRCVEVDPCSSRSAEDDCLAETEERAWSSPIFVDAKEG
ncbi:MAG: hypothetical protein CL910_12630, partial [Deltaproteobacteria bacterium]|nr:hypothetical protein [Deltaproteobacteria bacterium]